MSTIEETVNVQLSNYLIEREALIAREKEIRHGKKNDPPKFLKITLNLELTSFAGIDYAFRQRLSPTAKRAAAIVGNIRHHEAATVWTKEVEDDEGDVYPGMMFTLAKDRMEGTRLWKIAKRMPKGCLLHAHLEAMVESECFHERIPARPLLTVLGNNSGLVVESCFGNPRNSYFL